MRPGGDESNEANKSRTTGPGIGGLVGGVLINARGWAWALWLSAIITGVQLLAYVFTYRETLYTAQQPCDKGAGGFASKYLPRRVPGSDLGVGTFLSPLLFFQSPVVLVCALAYGVSFGTIGVGMAVIIPSAFGEFYGFGISQDGYVYVAVLIGVFIGEQAAGPVSDLVMKRHKRYCEANNKPVRAEHRLYAALPGYILAPIGLVIFGVTLQE